MLELWVHEGLTPSPPLVQDLVTRADWKLFHREHFTQINNTIVSSFLTSKTGEGEEVYGHHNLAIVEFAPLASHACMFKSGWAMV
jgi:hypothetical protein